MNVRTGRKIVGLLGVVIFSLSTLFLFAQQEKEIELKDAPPAVKATIEKNAVGKELGDIAAKTKDGKTIYEIEFMEKGEEGHFLVDADGKYLGAGEIEGGEVIMKEDEKAAKKKEEKTFTENFNVENLTFSTTGENEYFILKPGYQLTLESKDKEDKEVLYVTVLNETKKVGNIETRIVEERETENGEIKEISLNYFAICTQNNSVFYFGEESHDYKDGKVVGKSGSWEAFKDKNMPGVLMPGIILIGGRYYQEIAPKVAMDRAEILSNSEVFETPAGKFTNCLKTQESSAVESGKEIKYYAPKIGLIKDGSLLLTKYGLINEKEKK